MFILASSVFKSFHCLISALTQGGEGGHLFRLICSVVLWGGRTPQTISLVCVGNARSVWPTLGLLLLTECVLSQSTLLRLQVALRGNCLLPLFFLSLAIPQFGLLSHVSSLRLSSGHSGPVLTLSIQPMTPCSAPTRCWLMQVSGLLLHWGLWLRA